MKANVTLKESFLKRRISDYPKPADLALSNGKVYDLNFILDQNIVEIYTKKGETIGKEELTQEERCAIIEALLDEFSTFYKSIKHFTIAYGFEHLRLIDATYVEELELSKDYMNGGDCILVEYLKSDYSKKSSNVIYRILNEVYNTLYKAFRAKKFSGIIEIPIEFNLTRVQAMDLRYFTNQLIHAKQWAAGLEFDTNINKNRTVLTIDIEDGRQN